jgi:hypothetical protein
MECGEGATRHLGCLLAEQADQPGEFVPPARQEAAVPAAGAATADVSLQDDDVDAGGALGEEGRGSTGPCTPPPRMRTSACAWP